jgi:type IV pilus assembly protein PilO
MKASDFRNLDLQNAGGWPQSVKMAFCVLLFGLLALAGWWFIVRDQQDDLEKRQAQEEVLKKEFHDKQSKVANLAALKQQLDDMRDILRQLLRRLPSKTEMPGLLVDISQTALSAGLKPSCFSRVRSRSRKGSTPRSHRIAHARHLHQFERSSAALRHCRVVILTMHNVSLKPSRARPGAGPVDTRGDRENVPLRRG